MKIAPLMLAIAMTGCATAPEKKWYRNGATEQDYNISAARCRMGLAGLREPERLYPIGVASAAGTAIGNAGRDLEFAATQIQFMNDCMVSQGWVLR